MSKKICCLTCKMLSDSILHRLCGVTNITHLFKHNLCTAEAVQLKLISVCWAMGYFNTDQNLKADREQLHAMSTSASTSRNRLQTTAAVAQQTQLVLTACLKCQLDLYQYLCCEKGCWWTQGH